MDGCPHLCTKESSDRLHILAQKGKKELAGKGDKEGQQAEEILCSPLHLHESQGEKTTQA